MILSYENCRRTFIKTNHCKEYYYSLQLALHRSTGEGTDYTACKLYAARTAMLYFYADEARHRCCLCRKEIQGLSLLSSVLMLRGSVRLYRMICIGNGRKMCATGRFFHMRYASYAYCLVTRALTDFLFCTPWTLEVL